MWRCLLVLLALAVFLVACAAPDDCGDCDDGIACTVDRCSASVCTNTPDDALCGTDGACDATNGCESTVGACTTPADCDDTNPCTSDSCDATSGQCSYAVLLDLPCDDADACTVSDMCRSDGVCRGTTGVVPACDDGDPCTIDSCDATTGDCTNTVDTTAACDDGDVCTDSDACQADGSCAGTAVDCEDGNGCTVDSCDGNTGACVNTPDTGASCDDGLPCTASDICQADGSCSGVTAGCDDGNPCTTDSCDATTGACVNNIIVGASCDDGNFCTSTDLCQVDGSCAGTLQPCDDTNACTDDVCDPTLGCIFTLNLSNPCTDADLCTSNDACQTDGSCAGTAKNCDDSNECTADFCQPPTGNCVNMPQAGASCSDGDLCTGPDLCDAAGVCAGTAMNCDDGDPCTTDICTSGLCGNLDTGACAPIDWCRLQFPLSINDTAGNVVTVYGRVYVAGFTDLTNGTDTFLGMVAEVGYGPDGSDPSVDPSPWTWTTAGPNLGWSASAAGEPNNDEYQADLTLPAAGTYDHAYRFSGDYGNSWLYCDRAAGFGMDGSEDGYQVTNAGDLVSN